MKYLSAYTLSLLFSVLCLQGIAQDHQIERNKDGLITSVLFSTSDTTIKSIPANEQEFFKTYLETSPVDEFVQVPHNSKRSGFVHDRFDQYYKGVRVDEAGYSFHYKDAQMYFANGRYVKISHLDVTPRISSEESTAVFLQYKGIEKEQVDDAVTELLVKEITKVTGRDTLTSIILAYRIYFMSGHSNNDEMGYVNAHSGEVAMTEPRLTGWLLGTFETRYSGSRQADTDPVAGGHRLFDDTRGATIHTRNLQNASTNPTVAIELVDNDNNWTAAEHAGNRNDMALDVHWGLQAIYDYLNDAHDIDSYDDDGHRIEAYARYGVDDNAHRDNAFWDLALNVLYFGQGATQFSPLASIDVVAHEFGHGITDFQIGWPYTSNRAAFHEGLSDIWGVILEERIRPSATWRIGEQVTLNHSYLRNIEYPNDPSAMMQIANTFQSPQYNGGDHYVKSGVFSHWFYLLANGGSGTNGLGNNYNVEGVGLNLAEELIVEAVFNNYLNGATIYPDVRVAFIAAAEAISCAGSQLVISTTNAWHAVGVGSSHNTVISGPATLCTSDTYTVTNLPAGATVTSWSASPAGAVTLSGSGNSRTVAKTGSYNGNVTLTVSVSTACGNMNLTQDVFVGFPIIDCVAFFNTFEPDNTTCPPFGGVGYLCSTHTGNGIEIKTNSLHTQYEIQIRSYPSLTVLHTQTTTIKRLSLAYTPSTPGWYNIRVRAINHPCGTGPWYEDDIEYKDCNNPLGGGENWKVYPNPASQTLTISIGNEVAPETLPGKASMPSFSAVLHDSQGRQLRQGESKEGTVQFDTRQLPDGTYFLHIHHDGQVEKRQVVIRH